jgi:branched-chain amino acid aminotransferase
MFDTKYFSGAKKFWYMGKLYDWQSVNVHVMSHALHYGSSVFEGIRAYQTARGPAIFRLKEHIDRFFLSASTLNMNVPYSKDEIIDAIKLVMWENKLEAAYIRPNLFFGYGNLGLIPKVCPVELVVGCWSWGAYLGDESLEIGVHALLLNRRRIHPSQMDMRAKIGGMYAQSNIAGGYARSLGFEEGIFLNLEGRIAEGPGENILVVKNKRIKTNDESESILPGLTRTTILELAKNLGYATEIGPITIQELLAADEAFFTGTAAEVTPICQVTDGSIKDQPPADWKKHSIGSGKPGSITRQLSQKYAEVVRGKDPAYEKWLSYVYSSPEEAKKNLEVKEPERLSKY